MAQPVVGLRQDKDQAREDLQRALASYDYLRLTFIDLHGIPRSQAVPRRHFKHFLSEGTTVYAGSLALGTRTQVVELGGDEFAKSFSSAAVRPVPGTLHSLPWVGGDQHRVGEVFCQMHWPDSYRDGVPCSGCPRLAVCHQLDRLSQLGYQLYSCFELEFMMFKGARLSGMESTLTPVFEGVDMFASLLLSEFEPMLYDMEKRLALAGVDLMQIQTERSYGQFELVTEPTWGITAADSALLVKEGVKEMSAQHECTATFMTRPKPNSDNCMSNGLHFNHSLWCVETSATGGKTPEDDHSNTRGKVNAFHDASKKDGLSDAARHWIAGLVKHAPALLAFCSPTVNCYHRVHEFLTPDKADWDIDDSCAAFRVKNASPSATYVENRLPGGAANPYLVLAATVAAGLDGLANGLVCPHQRLAAEGDQAAPLPRSLSEALDSLLADTVMREALGEDLIRWFVALKREEVVDTLDGEEFMANKGSGSQFWRERKLYFKFL